MKTNVYPGLLPIAAALKALARAKEVTTETGYSQTSGNCANHCFLRLLKDHHPDQAARTAQYGEYFRKNYPVETDVRVPLAQALRETLYEGERERIKADLENRSDDGEGDATEPQSNALEGPEDVVVKLVLKVLDEAARHYQIMFPTSQEMVQLAESLSRHPERQLDDLSRRQRALVFSILVLTDEDSARAIRSFLKQFEIARLEPLVQDLFLDLMDDHPHHNELAAKALKKLAAKIQDKHQIFQHGIANEPLFQNFLADMNRHPQISAFVDKHRSTMQARDMELRIAYEETIAEAEEDMEQDSQRLMASKKS